MNLVLYDVFQEDCQLGQAVVLFLQGCQALKVEMYYFKACIQLETVFALANFRVANADKGAQTT